jgi:hypothetical protein
MSRREESVLEIYNRLKGAALEKFLKKWVRWVKHMLPPQADPAAYVGEPRITESTVLKLFKEYCPDLTQSECYDKLVEVFLYSKAAGKNVFDPTFIRSFERKATISSTISKILNLDWEVNPSVAEDLYRAIFEDRNVEQACELIRYDVIVRWTSLGEDPPQEELEATSKVCDEIKELVSKRAPPIEWWKVLEPIYRTREEIQPSIKPYIVKIKFWGIDKDVNYFVKTAKPEELEILAGEEAIKRVTKLNVRYVEDLKPVDLATAEAMKEFLEVPKVTIYPLAKVKEANDLIYVNKFRIDKVEIPPICIYQTKLDYLIACDRPAALVMYGERETKVIPIATAKMVKELFKRGILIEEKRKA